MVNRVKIEGLKELEKNLAELPKATGKAVLRRVLKNAAAPFDAAWRGMAPDDSTTSEGDLKASGGIGAKLSTRQRKLHRKMFRDDRAAVEVFAGPGPGTAGIANEFGTGERHQKSGKSVGSVDPQPFVRPAWDQTKDGMLDTIKSDLAAEIDKSAQRLAARARRFKA